MNKSKNIGKNVDSLLTMRNISRAKLARSIDVSTSSLNRYIRGEVNWSDKALEKVSEFFGISVESLEKADLSHLPNSDIKGILEKTTEVTDHLYALEKLGYDTRSFNGVREHLVEAERLLLVAHKKEAIIISKQIRGIIELIEILNIEE